MLGYTDGLEFTSVNPELDSPEFHLGQESKLLSCEEQLIAVKGLCSRRSHLIISYFWQFVKCLRQSFANRSKQC